uniref:SH3 domain-containing protein n=1 Tax=Meloidogyne javanica TaxID=6303 RepID=A0A915LVI1_MELJA
MEMIDLRKGDILQFRIEDDLKNNRKHSDNLAGCSPSQYSPIQTLPTSPEMQNQHQLEQDCWSAPACPNDSPDSFEIGEGDEEFSKDMNTLSSEKQDLNYRKESSWSAPGQFNSEMIEIDLLSESEISDLEQQIASGCLVNRDRVLTTNYEGDERTNKHSSIDDEYSDQDLEDFKQQKPSDNDDNEMHSFETEKYRHHHLPQMRFHYSMPAIVNSLQDSVPDRVKFRRSDTEDFLIERKAGASSEYCETEDKLPAFNPNNRQHLSLSFTSKRRQLPKTPSPEDPLEHIDIATASRERLLDVLKQTYQLLNLSREKEGGRNKISYMNCEDQLDHNREKDESKLALQSLPSPSVLREIQSKLPKNCCRAQALEDEQQYTFSYGMDHSTNARSIGRRRLFSIEGSYYEDNLPGVAAPLDGYIFADGAKSSSGISSSCYTSSSRSCELPDCDQQQKTTPRERRTSPRLDDPSIVPTHRAQFEFMPRHADELRLDRGDAVHVNEKFNDHWCFGLNLRSGQRGIFPEALIVEIDLVDEICKKVLMEISFRGIHVIDKRKKDVISENIFKF